jgi:hypothetical protein
MKTCIARFTMLMLIGAAMIFAVRFTDSRANAQQPERIVVRKPWPVEPVKVVSVKNKE